MTGTVIWLTGLPSSGKTTLAAQLLARLRSLRLGACVLDGDDVRAAMVPTPGYTGPERERFYRSLANLASGLARQGLFVLVPATAHKRTYRRYARKVAPRFVEVFVDTPAEQCAERDAKGLYRAAKEGLQTAVPGVGVEYEIPENADVIAVGGASNSAIEETLELVLSARVASDGGTMTKPVLTIDECMSPSPVSIRNSDTMQTAHELMRTHQIRHLPVVTEDEKLVGLVSLRDLHLMETLRDVEPGSVTVGECVRDEPYSVEVGTDLKAVATYMGARKYGSAVVVDEGKVVGVFTTIDALRALSNLL